jgi:hypothetical protein
MKPTLTFSALSLFVLFSCSEHKPPTSPLLGKWGIVTQDQTNSAKVYNKFDSDKVFIERVYVDSSYYQLHGDTMIMQNLRDKSKKDTGTYKILNRDTAIITASDSQFYYMVREH